ncbi:MAG: 3-deoxy-manno-octulosonate cytidylyltransferase [Oligoflexia bacterium]|nr:3-deoxy-manno-octulosonate cytidylyltransferase [Oligoflexia bacterium]
MSVIIVIPARYGSSRFPGKPLAVIKGRTLIERVWSICKTVRSVDRVYIATDDQRIEAAAKKFKAEVVLTDPHCANGTERVFDALKRLAIEPQVVVNMQGDAVLTPPGVLEALCAYMLAHPEVQMATPAAELSAEEYSAATRNPGRHSATYVTFDNSQNALYFSRALIPKLRDADHEKGSAFRHIGIYAYRPETLRRYLELPEGRLEKIEKLEQLRALENGIPIKVVTVNLAGRTPCSIDRPEDISRAEELISAQGELT